MKGMFGDAKPCHVWSFAAEPKKGNKVDPFAPLVADPNSVPAEEDPQMKEVRVLQWQRPPAGRSCSLRRQESARYHHDLIALVLWAQVGTAWRPDKLKEMTYTQFWHLVQQRQIDKVTHALDAMCKALVCVDATAKRHVCCSQLLTQANPVVAPR